jgi:uncharacterized protein YjbI with pentapeptide repeats
MHAVEDRFGVVDGGRVAYRPQDGYVGPDSFVYEACNEVGCDTATVSITVAADVPVPDLCSGTADPSIMFSFDIDRRDAEELGGVGFLGPDAYITIFAMVPETTRRVSFYIDDPDRRGAPFSVENRCPYDLIGTGADGLPARAITLSDFGNGFHTLTIAVLNADDTITVENATFGVLVGGDPGPPPPNETGADCARARAGDRDLEAADLENCLLAGQDLRGADLAGADLTQANLAGANLTDAVLEGAVVIGADLTNATLDNVKAAGANFGGVMLGKASATSADFEDALVNDADLAKTDFTNADFGGAYLQRSDLTRSTIKEASFSDADLGETNFTDAIGLPDLDDDPPRFAATICPDGTTTDVGCWP